jgi:hypothetical protein
LYSIRFSVILDGVTLIHLRECINRFEGDSKIENTESQKGHREKERGAQGSVLSDVSVFQKDFFR